MARARLQRRARGADPWLATVALGLGLLWLDQVAGDGAGGGAFDGAVDGASAGASGGATWCDLRPVDAVPPGEANARQLRALPGIGRGRARDLIEAGQRRGAPVPLADWAALSGIGAGTVAEVRRFLQAGGR
jgi:hypothetical protein